MNNHKEAERAELHKTIWRIANDLRGSVDGWDFKTYVLGMLFYRFISENLTAYLNTLEREAGEADFDYTHLSDADARRGRSVTVDEKGFYIFPSQLFANMRKRARQDANLNETLSRVFKDIEASALGAALAFTLHILSWLAVNGTAAIVEFPGVLYHGGAEQKIRQYLIDNNYVDTVIQLPPDLFFGTTIATCVIVLKKSKHDNKTLFIDASAEFARSANKNKLTEAHQQKILDAFVQRQDSEHFAKLVDNTDIAANSYNIAVSSYVEAEDKRKQTDIRALNANIARIVARQTALRTQIDAIVADLERENA